MTLGQLYVVHSLEGRINGVLIRVTHTRMIAVANAMPLNLRPHAYLTPICDAEQLCIDAAPRSALAWRRRRCT